MSKDETPKVVPIGKKRGEPASPTTAEAIRVYDAIIAGGGRFRGNDSSPRGKDPAVKKTGPGNDPV